ncbi:SusD/RagB family nutrient-binding outer membrane lipoprotein [Flavitalea sp. BT771]|uniref:SusD/RagB family nutrient-binding outer membrane lipoprotein n=1 Tax=Flavitalea sp. BT771 TaxID=3063329 RepID=UPI0026E1F3A3|nr:SusD/RagB family nutrient-binding outer membrane lipoprotein [Flavitalea sp. BT771]MDO6430201.1 SusD/RagB family nutrient-binding outer membrane lipoprotein [Flavitalea sp. BT771]MDV6219660.1 SusD/RagB family nutrient-binding outer membrane lipoprotein [Flavitalea sp. BT771]
MKLYKYSLLLVLPLTVLVSCKKSAFVETNINPSTLVNVDPGAQFLYAARSFPNDFEYYYDILRDINAWMQYTTGNTGNSAGFNRPGGNFNYRYGNYYNNIGTPLVDIQHIIAKMSDADKAARVYEGAIASIYLAQATFYCSDINGSIVYGQGFQARYGGTLTPTYDVQQKIFDTLDAQIKAAVTTLETKQSVGQIYYKTYDPFFTNSDTAAYVNNWIKAANALRLKIAMRLMKRDPNKLKSIAQDVLADANQMSSIGDSWVLLVGPTYADQLGNYNPTGFLAAKPMIDFMNAYSDPRLPFYYRKNGAGLYVGSPTSPDICALPANQALYTSPNNPFSSLQHRLFTPNYDEADGQGTGSGIGFFPVLTYAEYCFIRADLAARGYTSDVASDWYNKGVTASIKFYDARAKDAKISDYAAVADGDITVYLNQPGIAFNAATATEQIACQAYLDFFRQPAEAWAWWKRTGFPNTTSVVAWSPLKANGADVVLARRPVFTPYSAADANYANQKAAYDAMLAQPGFGASLDDFTGRIWWDQ